jgi:hypothetical protein
VDLVGASLCVPANLPAPAAGNPSELLPTETIVPDPSCQGRNFFGSELPGCCDPTGVCGVSTEPFASGGAPLPGLAIPITCIAPGEISFPGLPAPAQSVAPIACGIGAGDEDVSSEIDEDAGAAPDDPNPANEDESTLEDAGSDADIANDNDDPEEALDAGSLDAGSLDATTSN